MIFVDPDATPEDNQSSALFFENEQNHFLSGKFFLLSGQFNKVKIFPTFFKGMITLSRFIFSIFEKVNLL
jgi:hypothetical protein